MTDELRPNTNSPIPAYTGIIPVKPEEETAHLGKSEIVPDGGLHPELSSGLSDNQRKEHGHETDTEELIEHLQTHKVDEIVVEPVFETVPVIAEELLDAKLPHTIDKLAVKPTALKSNQKPLNAGDVGHPTVLTEELTLQIRLMILKGVQINKIQEELKISENTWDSWYYRNTQGFRDSVTQWRRERMVRSAEDTVAVHVYSDDERVSLNASTFLLETLGKDQGYSKRSELTGPNGAAIQTEQITGMKIVKDDGNNISDKKSQTA